MKRWITIACCLLFLILAGFLLTNRPAEPEPQTYDLYFRRGDLSVVEGDAIAAQAGTLPVDNELEPSEAAEQLMQELLAGPADDRLMSSIPAGTVLNSLTVESGRADVDLSRPYRGLSGVELTLADYCIALTLTQLPSVNSVSVTVNGQELAYRSGQLFRARDVLLSTTEDIVETLDVTLYFLDRNGAFRGELRTLELYEGDTRTSALLAALQEGTEDPELHSAIPEGFRVRSMWIEEGECYVNLSSAALSELPPDTDLRAALQALNQSLRSLDSVQSVQLLVDGEFVENSGATLAEQLFRK